MELRSSAGVDFAVFGRSTFLIDSGFLAPRKRRSAERSRRYKYRIAVSMYMTELACGMPPHVTRPRPRDRTPGRSKLPLALKNLQISRCVWSLVDSFVWFFFCCGNSWFARLFFYLVFDNLFLFA